MQGISCSGAANPWWQPAPADLGFGHCDGRSHFVVLDASSLKLPTSIVKVEELMFASFHATRALISRPGHWSTGKPGPLTTSAPVGVGPEVGSTEIGDLINVDHVRQADSERAALSTSIMTMASARRSFGEAAYRQSLKTKIAHCLLWQLNRSRERNA